MRRYIGHWRIIVRLVWGKLWLTGAVPLCLALAAGRGAFSFCVPILLMGIDGENLCWCPWSIITIADVPAVYQICRKLANPSQTHTEWFTCSRRCIWTYDALCLYVVAIMYYCIQKTKDSRKQKMFFLDLSWHSLRRWDEIWEMVTVALLGVEWRELRFGSLHRISVGWRGRLLINGVPIGYTKYWRGVRTRKIAQQNLRGREEEIGEHVLGEYLILSYPGGISHGHGRIQHTWSS